MRKIQKNLFLFTLFFLQSYLIRFQIGPYPTNLLELLIGANLLLFVFQLNPKKIKKFFKDLFSKRQFTASLLFLTIFSFLIAISIQQVLNSVDLLRHLKFTFYAISLVLLFFQIFSKTEEREKAIHITGYGAATFGFFSLLFNLAGLNVTHDLRLLGPLDSAVYLAYYLTPFFIYFTLNALQKKETFRKDLKLAFVLAILILGTRSMGAIGGSFLIISLYLFFNQIRSIKAKTTILTLGVLIFCSIFYLKILPTLNTNYSSLDERGQIWTTAAELLKNPKNLIFGVGLGQFEANYMEKVDEVLGHPPLDYLIIQPHNIFLLFIFQYGIAGIIWIFAAIFLVYKSLKTDKKNIFAYILLYFLIHGLIDTPWFKSDMLFLLLLTIELTNDFRKNLIGKPRNQLH